MLDVPGLADYLAVSEKFVRRLVDQRRIPFRKGTWIAGRVGLV
jgi:hypothetical protein